MVTPATATTRARLTMVFQVSGRAWAASIAAAFAATDAGLPSPAAPPGGCRECPPAVTSWFIPVTSLQQPVPAQRDNHPHAVPPPLFFHAPGVIAAPAAVGKRRPAAYPAIDGSYSRSGSGLWAAWTLIGAGNRWRMR